MKQTPDLFLLDLGSSPCTYTLFSSVNRGLIPSLIQPLKPGGWDPLISLDQSGPIPETEIRINSIQVRWTKDARGNEDDFLKETLGWSKLMPIQK